MPISPPSDEFCGAFAILACLAVILREAARYAGLSSAVSPKTGREGAIELNRQLAMAVICHGVHSN